MANSPENINQRWLSRLSNVSFLLLVTSLGFPQIPVQLFGHDVLSTDLLFLLTGALWTASVAARQRPIRWHKFYWALLAYSAAMLISAMLSVDRATSISRFPEEVYLICLAVLTFNIVDSEQAVKRTVVAWLVGTAVAVIFGLTTIVAFYIEPQSPWLEYLTYHYGSVPVGNYPRITSGFISASMLCNYLNVSFVLALLAYKENWLPRKLNAILIFTITVTAAFTISIGLGGFALAAGIWLLLTRQSLPPFRKVAFVAGCLVALLFLVISPFALSPYPGSQIFVQFPFFNLELIPSARMLVWADALRTFISHPLTGIGLGKPVANVVFPNTDGTSSLLTDAHNCFLSVAAQNGVIGLVAFLSIVTVVMRRWWREIANSKWPTVLGALGIAFLCSFIYQGLTGSFEDARHLWVLIGMFLAADRAEMEAA